MKIQVDKTKKIPLYKQIVEQIQAQITSGEIPRRFSVSFGTPAGGRPWRKPDYRAECL